MTTHPTDDNDELIQLDTEELARFDALTPEQQAAELAELGYEEEADAALAGEDTVPVAAVPKPKLSKLAIKLLKQHPIYTDEAVVNMPPPTWFIDGLIPAGPRTLIHGAGAARKSFVMLDWMLSAASGVDWLGHSIRPGKVLYIAGEGIAGIGKRIKAWEATHCPVPDGRIYFMSDPINLLRLSKEEIAAWAAVFAYARYDYVVVDTVHTAMAGGEENSATEIGTLLSNATKIAGGNDGAQVFFVHHDPKASPEASQKRTARGSSSFRDSVDVCLGLFADPKRNLVSTLWCDKVRDAEEFMDMSLRFAISGDGNESSLYIAAVDNEGEPDATVMESIDLTDDARRLIQWLRKTQTQKKAQRWTTQLALRDDAQATGMTNRQIERALAELVRDGRVTKQDKVWRETPNPTAG